MGGGVFQSTDLMLTYHCGALEGSPAYAATCAGARLITVSVMTSTGMVSVLRLETRVEAAEHRVPTPLMKARRRIGQPRMGKAQIRLGVAGGLEFDGDHAGDAAGVLGDPGENQATRGIDLEVFARVFDDPAVSLHHHAQLPADAKVDVSVDRPDRR